MSGLGDFVTIVGVGLGAIMLFAAFVWITWPVSPVLMKLIRYVWAVPNNGGTEALTSSMAPIRPVYTLAV